MSARAASEPQAEGATTGRALGFFRRRPLATVLLVVLTAMVVLHAAVFETFTVPSNSMEPTFVPGDRIVVDKLSDVPRRGQVVVFSGDGSLEQDQEPTGFRGVVDSAASFLGFRLDERDYLKRIIGVGGDHLKVGANGRLLINGRPVAEPYLRGDGKASDVPFDITVPAGTVFVMGDNRDHSNDSRNHLGDPGGGFVPVDKIIGTVSWRYWHG